MLRAAIAFTAILLLVFTWPGIAQHISRKPETGTPRPAQNKTEHPEIHQQQSEPGYRSIQILPASGAAQSPQKQSTAAQKTNIKIHSHDEINWTDIIAAISTGVIAVFTLLLVINAIAQIHLQRRLARLERPRVLLVPYQHVPHDVPNLFVIDFWYDCINVGRAPAILGDINWAFTIQGSPPPTTLDIGRNQTDHPTIILGVDSGNNTHKRDESGAVRALLFDRDRGIAAFRDGTSEFILRTSVQYSDASDQAHISRQAFRFNFRSGAWEQWGGDQENKYS